MPAQFQNQGLAAAYHHVYCNQTSIPDPMVGDFRGAHSLVALFNFDNFGMDAMKQM
jgi:hypothetical protein